MYHPDRSFPGCFIHNPLLRNGQTLLGHGMIEYKKDLENVFWFKTYRKKAPRNKMYLQRFEQLPSRKYGVLLSLPNKAPTTSPTLVSSIHDNDPKRVEAALKAVYEIKTMLLRQFLRSSVGKTMLKCNLKWTWNGDYTIEYTSMLWTCWVYPFRLYQ